MRIIFTFIKKQMDNKFICILLIISIWYREHPKPRGYAKGNFS